MQCSFSDFYLQGYGTNFYSYNEYFEGEWYADKRSGWGRMYYTDGSVYEGEWYNDLRNGEGMLRLGNLFYFTSTCTVMHFLLSIWDKLVIINFLSRWKPSV